MADWNWDNEVVKDIVDSYEDNDVSFAPKDYWNDEATFIGPNSKSWNKRNFEKAKKLEKKGVSPREIWKQTGTGRSLDGKWRQEISDAEALGLFHIPQTIYGMGLLGDTDLSEYGERLANPSQPYHPFGNPYITESPNGVMGVINSFNKNFAPYDNRKIESFVWGEGDNEMFTPGGYNIGGGLYSVLDHQKLYDAYPYIETTPITVDYKSPTRDGNIVYGMNYPNAGVVSDKNNLLKAVKEAPNVGKGSITINAEAFRPTRYNSETDRINNLMDTLLHENQHTIQTIENFGRGGNPDSISLEMINDPSNPFNQYAGYRELPDSEKRFGIYANLPGEIEAENVVDRRYLNDRQRREHFPFVQQDENNPYGMRTNVPFEIAQDMYQWYNQPSVQSLLGK